MIEKVILGGQTGADRAALDGDASRKMNENRNWLQSCIDEGVIAGVRKLTPFTILNVREHNGKA